MPKVRVGTSSYAKNAKMETNVMPTAVMGTNDNCTVSKRSVEMLYYTRPHFYRYFVKKPKKRTSLINRGYLLRMKAIEYQLKAFLSQTSGQKVVINLGCGFDALPFRALSEFSELCSKTVFVDVDYEALIREKVQIVKRNQELLSLLGNIDSTEQDSIVIQRAEKYLAVACDLTESRALQDLLVKEFDSEVSLFIISEVSITYMPVETADALLAWMSCLKSAKFCLLEQYLPNGPNHPFASTMLKHFNKLSSPLRVVQKYQSIESQQDRFYNHGWTNVQAQSLWAVWCEGQVFSPEERTTLRSVEIFDEHEEFALFASHYFILTATSLGPRKDIQNPPSSIKHSFSLDKKPHTLSRLPARRDGVLYEAQNNVFMYYGGDDCRTRMTTSQIYINNDGVDAKYDLEQLEISARKHHTITRLHAGYDYLLVGGRDSPERPLRDCWLLKDSSWSRVEDLPIPLFRHSATLVEIKTERDQCASGVIVVGGKTRHDRDSNAWFLWRESQGWKELKVESEEIVPIFSANCLYLSEQQTGILIGGMLSSEVVNDKIYAWTLSGEEICINPIQNTAYREDGFEVCRLGANLVQYKDSVFLVGGLTRNGLPWMTNHLTGAILEFKLHSDVYDPENVSLKCCTNRNTFRWPLEHEEPFLIGHSTIVKDNLLSIVGGGAVCFSFGSFMNSTSWHLDIGNDNAENWKTGIWKIYRPKDTPDLEVFHVNGDALNQDAHHLESERSLTSRGYISVNRLNSTTKETLSKRILKGKPCIFESVNLGCCIEKWTPEYLKQALDPERLLDIHYATADTMLFESKNFEIQKQKFPDFIDAVGVGQRRYLRAVSFKDKHKPANFYKDFEALASDFRIPIHLSITEKMQHSSVFRISGPVNMWLHYDTLSNILCQIRGSKRLILFSPADVAHLKIPAGRSSSDLNVFDKMAWETTSLKHTHPYEAILRPGDVLYIPPLWCHAALPLDGISVAINIFFKTEDDQRYSEGNDTYGNRDVAEYEHARNDISKAIGRFALMPKDARRFYLERLANEVTQQARKKG